MAIYITGSMAYDRIMTFPGKFSESILPEHLDILNVSFFINHLNEMLGGNAGNIAYTLALLGQKPIIVSSVGKDFAYYKNALAEHNLPLDGIYVNEEALTASAYIITDQVNNQITAFHAAAAMQPSPYTFPHLDANNDIALIGPTNPEDMNEHPNILKEKGVRYIYDPAQQLPVLATQDIANSIDGAYLLMGNDYEITLIAERMQCSLQDLVARTTRGVFVTQGEKGSVVYEKNKKPITVPAAQVSKVVDPTGAGDAYRAGVIHGLLANLSLESCGKIGTVCSAYCIEHAGTQTYKFTHNELVARFEKNFGPNSFPI